MVYLLFILGLIFLVKGADLLVQGAASIAQRLNVSQIVIGLTIVAFGTSMPEFMVNILAAWSGQTDIAIGNVLGSNIANILLILGISALIFPLTALGNTVRKEIPFSLFASVVLAVLVNDSRIFGTENSFLSRGDGLVLLGLFLAFMIYTFRISKISQPETSTPAAPLPYMKAFIFIGLGLLGLVFGGQWIVDGAIAMAASLQMDESLVGLTIVAVGTSLPELATSAMAAYRRQSDIAIGNVVGSNIFNILWILGCSALLSPLPFSAKLDVDIGMTVFSSLLLLLMMYVGKKFLITRWKGGLFLLLYLFYILFLVFYH